MRRGLREGRSSGRTRTSTSRIANPAALRMHRVSSALKTFESARIETAIAENDSSAPTIQNTTLPILDPVTERPFGWDAAWPRSRRSRDLHSFGVGLVLGPGFFDRGEFLALGFHRHDAGKAIERHLQA